VTETTSPQSQGAPADAAATLPTQYAPAQVEGKLYERWVRAGYFEADAKSDRPAHSIVIPPPNVNGSLHIGHALDMTLQDAITRRKRMQGFEALWLPGMDHAGIATQNAVEKEIAKHDGLSRHDLGREAFVERVWQWKAEYGGRILNQMRRLGASVDWSRERFTFDAGLSRAVQTIFKRLYDDDLIYRAERIINWCPRCMTALSDIEVDHSEDEGELVSIRYGDGANSIVVATTRAETMLGDTGVAVHPDDERYKHLVGTEVELPFTGRRIPIVADRHVDPEFGTGAVKVTPAHDPNDFEIGQRHGLPALLIMDERGSITAHGPFEGLDRFEARPAIVAALPPRRLPPCATAGCASTRRSSSRATSPGPTTCWTGASPGSCGGDTASRCGTARTARWCAWARTRSHPAPKPRVGRRTRTCSTPGSRPACGRSPRSAGPTRPTTCASSTRPACW
jgi:valyl-tRNA synthetase